MKYQPISAVSVNIYGKLWPCTTYVLSNCVLTTYCFMQVLACGTLLALLCLRFNQTDDALRCSGGCKSVKY